jgi:hypothetical protein
LSELPRNPNGKVDRGALPISTFTRADTPQPYATPRTPSEESLAEIWSELLGTEEIGIHDNFFDVGGHSLLAAQCVDRVNRRMNASLRITDLFSAPTIAGLAGLVAMPSSESTGPRLLSTIRAPGQQGTVVWIGGHITGLLKSLPQTIGILRLGLDGMDTDVFSRLDIESTIDRYTEELLELRPRGPLIIAGFSYCGLLAYALAIALRPRLCSKVEAVLLEPSVPSSRSTEPKGFVQRAGRYLRRFCQSGPIIIYRSLRYRLLRLRAAPPPHMDAETAKKWEDYLPHYLQNVENYLAPNPLQHGVHLVAGARWLAGSLDIFKIRFKEDPQIHNVAEVSHLDLPNRDECIAVWIRLINQIVSDSESAEGATRFEPLLKAANGAQ